jgi:hypothetical protein
MSIREKAWIMPKLGPQVGIEGYLPLRIFLSPRTAF